MDSTELFRKIGIGAKFDLKKFKSDAEKFKLIKNKSNSSEEITKALDFFGSADEQQKKSEIKTDFCDEEPFSKRLKTTGTILDESASHDEPELQLFGNGITLSMKATKSQKKKLKKKTRQHLAHLKQEQVNRFRKQNNIHVWGSDIPDPISNFDQLSNSNEYKIPSCVMSNISSLGYEVPTPIQMQAIPLMLQRRELLACAPTGSGKTAAFLIPVLQHLKEPRKLGFRALVVSPTRELARQTYLECLRISEGTGLRIHLISKVSQAIKKFGQNSSHRFDILITTPNRLVYMLQMDSSVITLKNVEWLIVDESDKLFEAGKQGFRDQLAVIYKACDSVNIRRAMFSATFTFEVEEWCKLNLDNVVIISVGIRNSAADTVNQKLLFVGSESGKLMAFRNLIHNGFTPPVLVFVQSKERAKELFSELVYDGINVDVIHANRTQLQRDNVVKSFRAGKIWVLICTELMGRGIDFKGINLVINYDFPPSAISYIHRIGRTGRAGRKGEAITFFTEEDAATLRSIAQVMRDSGCEVPDYMLQLKKPSKNIKRQLLKKAPKRNRISTVPKYDLEKRAKLEKLIAKSKKQKYGSQKHSRDKGCTMKQELKKI